MVERATTEARLWALSLAVSAGGLALAAAASRIEAPADPPFHISWWVLIIAFALSERFVVDLDVRRQAQTLAFTEAPLTFGLMLADPGELIVTRVLVGVVAIAVFRRSAVVKLVFNAGMFAAQVSLAVLVFHLVLGDEVPVEPLGWVAALLAAAVCFLTSACLVTAVMRVAGADVTLRSQVLVIGVGLTAAVSGSAAAVAAASVLWMDGRSWILLVLLGGALGFFGLSYVRIRERHDQLAGINTYTLTLVSDRDLDRLVSAICEGIAHLLHAARVVVSIPNGAAIRTFEYRTGGPPSVTTRTVDPVEWSTALRVAATEGFSWAEQTSIAGVALTDPNSIVRPLPLSDGPGLVVVDGRLSVARTFDDEDLQLLDTAVSQAATAIHNAQLVNELREEAAVRARQALHDEVTDLQNSRGLAESLQLPLLAGTRLAILTVRIDSLREVNETLGRAMGDEMLQQAAARLSPLAEDSWCAKTATDEFTVVVRGGDEEALAMAEQVIEAFEAPVQCADVALAVTAGIGIVLAPDHGRETEILLRRASLAASRSRVEGTKVTTWAADRDPYDPQRLAIAADLRDAIPAGELQVHFQPQVDIDSGLVTGAEALVRWRHPRLGELRPDQFIAAAEYTGAIDALTEHVLSVAARTCAGWRQQGWDLDVSVNLSARNLANAAFAELVAGILDDTGLDPAALTLELTESSIMTEAEGAMGTLAAIHDLGVSLSIDDFGTGYSSLAHLRKLPVSEIKIDKSFVFDLTTSQSDEAIVRSMVDLGHHLGLTVVVEGVETVEVRRRLAEMGADRIQGYLLSRPMPVAAFELWIADRPVRMAELSTSDAEAGAPSRIENRER
jgi:diguanylate cyclase (GGDEF)-like protein